MATKNLTLKIQGRGHGWGQSIDSHYFDSMPVHPLIPNCMEVSEDGNEVTENYTYEVCFEF